MATSSRSATDSRRPPAADGVATTGFGHPGHPGSLADGANPAGADVDPNPVDEVPLPRWARRIRMIAALVVFALITLGTVHGGDDDFPFGPLRMYASRDNPNGVVHQGVVEAVTRSGRILDVTNTSGAPRRAELEGRMSEFAAHPGRFAAVAVAFVPHGNAKATDPVVTIRLIRRGFPLHDGRAGPPADALIASWTVDP